MTFNIKESIVSSLEISLSAKCRRTFKFQEGVFWIDQYSCTVNDVFFWLTYIFWGILFFSVDDKHIGVKKLPQSFRFLHRII